MSENIHSYYAHNWPAEFATPQPDDYAFELAQAWHDREAPGMTDAAKEYVRNELSMLALFQDTAKKLEVVYYDNSPDMDMPGARIGGIAYAPITLEDGTEIRLAEAFSSREDVDEKRLVLPVINIMPPDSSATRVTLPTIRYLDRIAQGPLGPELDDEAQRIYAERLDELLLSAPELNDYALVKLIQARDNRSIFWGWLQKAREADGRFTAPIPLPNPRRTIPFVPSSNVVSLDDFMLPH